MNSTDVNSIINNLCDKLGTTASKLIPEMAGYQIAKHSVWMVISLIFIGVAVGLTIKILWMRRNDAKMLGLYADKVRRLDQQLKNSGKMDDIDSWTRSEWTKVMDGISSVSGTFYSDDSTFGCIVFGAIISGLIGITIFGIALYHIIGWSIAPNASAFMWIINQLGGGQ